MSGPQLVSLRITADVSGSSMSLHSWQEPASYRSSAGAHTKGGNMTGKCNVFSPRTAFDNAGMVFSYQLHRESKSLLIGKYRKKNKSRQNPLPPPQLLDAEQKQPPAG